MQIAARHYVEDIFFVVDRDAFKIDLTACGCHRKCRDSENTRSTSAVSVLFRMSLPLLVALRKMGWRMCLSTWIGWEWTSTRL